MSEFLDRISKLSPQRLALLADELNARLQAAERRHHVPLAIVGIGCNFPGGVHSPEDFWKLLREGSDAVTEVPASRWDIDEFYDPNPETPGKMATRWGGFIDGHDQFDPKFFGIAPAEAVSMDPQQRLLLETSWEALEHAGIAPSKLAGTRAGVFVGICNGDYGQVALSAARETITPYFAPGLSHAVASGRISYVLGLQGPSIAVDTSCSASLVAVHLACQSLRLEECELAIAGGVNLIFNPDVTIALSQSKMMAPDGRCKAFSDSANGFVRGEGCGMIVLKRLPDAVRDGNRILAVVRGSACNQDGRSSGLTAPNGPSQEAVVIHALKDAGMRPDEVDVIEAHGTGTALGDPIEAGALNAVFATESRGANPLFVGSVKTNVGHLESAAGIAGLIKLVLAIEHGEIPPSLHFEKPSSHIEWGQSPIKIPTKLEEWKRRSQKRVGGVSSFGFSGTNAHVIVEEYPRDPMISTKEDRPLLFPISGRTPLALKRVAARLREYLMQHPELPLHAVAYTLAAGRSHFEYRAAVVSASHDELMRLLAAVEQGREAAGIYSGRASLHAAPMKIDKDRNSKEFLDEAAVLYVSGRALDLESLYGVNAETVVLPTYPFERERYWIEIETARAREQEKARRAEAANVEAVSGTSGDAFDSMPDEWIYDLVWEPKPLARGLSRSTAEKLDNDLLRNIALTPATPELMRVENVMAAVMPLYASYILQAFRKALPNLPASEFTLDELNRKLGALPARKRVLGRMLDILVEDKIAEKKRDRFRFIDFGPRSDPDRELERLSAEFPECAAEANVLRRCGKKLLEVLQGSYDPMQLVFSDGSVDEAEQIYENSPVCRFFNNTTANTIRSIADQVAGRAVRILEIGAGTGATTKPVLAELADAGVEFDYTFTDISPVFLSHARIKFAQYASVNYRLLNVEDDPQAQGFEPGQYDIILAANVLHATADLRRTITHARSLLAPGGFLLLLEGVRPDRWLDMTFGLTDGWWRSVDGGLRPHHPLISAETWKTLLRDAGMSFSRTVFYVCDDGALSHQTLIVAQADCGEPEVTPAQSPMPSGRNWILFADEFGIGNALAKLLKDRGEICQVIPRPESDLDVSGIFDHLEKLPGAEWNAIYLWSIGKDDCDVAREGKFSSTALLHCIQQLPARLNGDMHFWVVTRGAQPTTSFAPSLEGAVQSMVWGIGRVLGLEAPEAHRALIDLDPALTPEAAANELLTEILSDDQEDEIAYRNGKRLVSRLQRSHLNNSLHPSPSFAGLRPNAAYLLVGGLGGVGLRVARWAAEEAAGHLVLLSRTGVGAAAGAFAKERVRAIDEIQKLGTKVTVVDADVVFEPDMKALFRRFGDDLPPLRGIFQCATEVHGATLAELTDAEVGAMLRPKVQGTLVLHELTRTMDLDFFLAFSSTTSLLGAKGMAHYAAANQFLDSFAHFRRGSGLPMLSVNWGSWDVIRRASKEDKNSLKEAGLLPMDSRKVLKGMGGLTVSSRAQVMIADIDWKTFKPLYEVRKTRPLLEKISNAIETPGPATASASLPAVENSLQNAFTFPPEKRKKYIEEFVMGHAARTLGYRRGEVVPVDVPLMDLGLDSLMAVDLRNHLQTALGQEMPPTVVFDYPTVAEIAGMLEARLWAGQKDLDSSLMPAEKDEIRI